MSRAGSEILIKFKDDGKYIVMLKDGKAPKGQKFTRKELDVLISEAMKRNRIVDLTGADLSKMNLQGLTFGRANLTYADLSSSDLSNAVFFNANLSHSNLSNANLTFADFSYADLSDAKWIGANISNTNLFRAIITDQHIVRQ